MNEEFVFLLTNGKQTKKISWQKSHILKVETYFKKRMHCPQRFEIL